jgi:hypothetical protein
MRGAASKPLEWIRRAFEAYHATLLRIAEDDPPTARLVREQENRSSEELR